MRWDASTPLHEKHDDFSFFNPNGVNSAAGGRLGTLAYAGKGWGPASYGSDQPASFWTKGFGPRFGFAYKLGQRTVLRGGYGIFYGAQFYNLGGISQTGFSTTIAPPAGVSSVSPAIWMQSSGSRVRYDRPRCGFLRVPHAGTVLYSTALYQFDPPKWQECLRLFATPATPLPYVQQFTFSIEHRFTNNLMVTATYTGSKGTRLGAGITGYNVLNPFLLKQFDRE